MIKLNWLTKKRLFVLSLLSTIGFLIMIPRDFLYNVCSRGDELCVSVINYSILIFMIGASIFIISIIMFFRSQEIFESWKNTLFIYLFIYLFIAIITPWDVGDAFLYIQKDLVLIFVAGIYFLFSLFFIFYKSLKSKKQTNS